MSADARPCILLVDDRPENLVALEAVLAPLGCRLVTATSGAEALKRLLETDFALILLDVQMPDLDGFETAEYIKRRERTRNVPIIFVTAISKEQHHVFRGYETGAVDYVFKPYDPVVLRSKVGVFVELWRAGQALRASEALGRATFEHAPIGMARVDAGGHIVAANRALTRTLGRDVSAVVGCTLDQLTHREDRRREARRRRALLAGEIERYEEEVRLLDGEGRPVPALVSVALVGAGDAEPPLLAQVLDLRERKRAERQRELLVREQAARLQAEAVSERLEAIQRILDAALAPLALDELLAELLSRITSALGVDSASFVLDEGERGHVIVHGGEGVDGVPVRRVPFEPFGGGPYARAVRERAPVVIDDAASHDELRGALLGSTVTSMLAVPLLVGDEAIGALVVGTLFHRSFSPDDIDLLQLAGERAALSIVRARLFEREHRIAQQLQRALLPERLPNVAGLRLAARYLPGGAGTEVGGDWYDALELPGGRLVLVMGDVAGRGVAAAATMGQLRSALRAYALEGVGPADVLERLNRFQLAIGEEGMATVVVLLLDPADGRMRYANAGHPPPLVVTPDGPAFLGEARGVPLGAMDEPGYAEAEAGLAPGTTVVVYTDGLIERRGHSLEEGFARLRAAATDGKLEPDLLCDAILGGTLGETVSSDDVTFVVASSPALEGDRLSLSLPGEHEGLASLRGTVRRWLQELDAAPEEVNAVTMAANEAVQNAIEHAHGLSAAPFEVELERVRGEVVVTVRDHGEWRDHPSRGDDRGRGLPLMRALMDDVAVDPSPTGSRVILRRRLRGADGEGSAST